jgi:urease accessory protein UreE
MLVIEQIPATIVHETLVGKERDTIVMTSEERRWGRRRVRTTASREIALALPTGVTLDPDAIIAVEPTWYLQVEAAAEPVLAVHPHDRDAAVRIAFEIGNHHFPLAIDHGDLLVPDDTAMVQLLNRLGEPWERRRVVFNPIAKAHRHDP